MYNALCNSLGRSNQPFTPLRYQPALWLDAADANTLYDSTVGGSLVAADGTVARWEDKSGNGRHATQSTGVSQPLRKTAAQNGRDVVRFDGANDGLSLASALSMPSATVFVVQNTTGDGYLLSGQSGVNRQTLRIGRDGANVLSCFDGSAEAISSTLSTSRGTASLVQTVVSSGTVTFYENGTSRGTGSHAATEIQDIGFIFFPVHINGDIAEVIAYPTALSDANRRAVEAYLSSKWGITIAST